MKLFIQLNKKGNNRNKKQETRNKKQETIYYLPFSKLYRM